MAITVMCGKDEPGAIESKGWSTIEHPIFVRTFAIGMVVRTWERNGYDDSDFFATYWDESKSEWSTIEYATTRGWTYPNGASVDASDELKQKYHDYLDGIRKKDVEDFHKKVRETLAKIGLTREDHFRFFLSLSVEKRTYLFKFLSTKVKSDFRKSLQKQAFDWLMSDPSGRKYDFPLSPKQFEAIIPYGYHNRKHMNYDLMSTGEILSRKI